MSSEYDKKLDRLVDLRGQLRSRKFDRLQGLERLARAEQAMSKPFESALKKAQLLQEVGKTPDSEKGESKDVGNNSGSAPSGPPTPNNAAFIADAQTRLEEFQTNYIDESNYDDVLQLDAKSKTFIGVPYEFEVGANGMLFSLDGGESQVVITNTLVDLMLSLDFNRTEIDSDAEVNEAIESYYLLLNDVVNVNGVKIEDLITPSYKNNAKYIDLKTYFNKWWSENIETKTSSSSPQYGPLNSNAIFLISRSVNPNNDSDDSSASFGEFKGADEGESSIVGEGISPQGPNKNRSISVDRQGKIGDLTIDMPRLKHHQVLHVESPEGVVMHVEVSEKLSKDLADLLTRKRMNKKRTYSQKAVDLFNKILKNARVNMDDKFSHKLGSGINQYIDTDDLLHRVSLLSSSMTAGNVSKQAFNELSQMLDLLLKRGVISSDEYSQILI